MKYTRYEYKKLSKIKFLCIVAVIIGISICGGLYIINFIKVSNWSQNIRY